MSTVVGIDPNQWGETVTYKYKDYHCVLYYWRGKPITVEEMSPRQKRVFGLIPNECPEKERRANIS